MTRNSLKQDHRRLIDIQVPLMASRVRNTPLRALHTMPRVPGITYPFLQAERKRPQLADLATEPSTRGI